MKAPGGGNGGPMDLFDKFMKWMDGKSPWSWIVAGFILAILIL